MPEAAVISDPLTAEVFILTDFSVWPVQESESVETVLNEILQQGYQLIFITENLAAKIPEEIKIFQKRNKAIITVIPGIGTTEGLGEKMLNELFRKLMGAGASITQD